MKFRRPHKANVDMAGKILTWRENSAASQRKHAWNGPWNALSPPRIFSCRHDNVMTTRDKNTVDISVVAVYENINKVTTRVDDDHCRTLVQFHKNQQHGNNYLYQDIVMKMKPKQPYVPKLQCHLIIYGIKSYQSNVDSSVYDALWYIDNNEKLAFNTPITLQNQSISGVKDAKNDDDAVNYKQLNTLEATLLSKLGALQPKSYYNTIFEYFFDLLDPSKFIMSDSFGAVVSGLFGNLIFQTTKLLKEFKPRDGFTGVFIVNFNENVTESDD